ncbi:hypothetical protein BJY52DRAFT_1388982, partial [Lactarius psammicola]
IDKVVIAQQSLQVFINALSPGAYSPITKVNFKILENIVLMPFGVYGSKEEIVRFFREIKAVDHSAYVFFIMSFFYWYLGGSEPVLRSGLYIVRSFLPTFEERAYVVYWPEDTTWDDRAASPVQHNRVTFMRYLSKLCDQLVCLLSSEHSRAIVWSDDDGDDDDDDDSDGALTDSERSDSDRFFYFEIAKTMDQEENVVVRAGFMMFSPLIVGRAPPLVDADTGPFCPVLLHGEKVQVFMTTTFMRARTIVEPFAHDHQTADQIRSHLEKEVVLCLSEDLDSASLKPLIATLDLSTRFPKEYKAWEKGKNEIERRFQQIISLRKAEIHAKIEQEFDGIRVTVQRAIVSELLKIFPSFRRERFLPGSSSADPTDHRGASNNAENSLRDLFLHYP